MEMDLIEFLRPVGEANERFFRDVIAPRLEETMEEIRSYRIFPIVVFLFVERAVDYGIDLALGVALGGGEA